MVYNENEIHRPQTTNLKKVGSIRLEVRHTKLGVRNTKLEVRNTKLEV